MHELNVQEAAISLLMNEHIGEANGESW